MKKRSQKSQTFNIVMTGLFIVLGIVLPFLTDQIPEIGEKLSSMHIPVFISGFVIGPSYGAIVGFLSPLLRSLFFGMPRLYPIAFIMAFELATYGLMSGILYRMLPKKNSSVVIALIISMIVGRFVWGGVSLIVYTINKTEFTLSAFMTEAYIHAIPTIILHILLVSPIIIVLKKAKLVK